MSVSKYETNRKLPESIGGHMLYHKEFSYNEQGDPVFIKSFDQDLIDDSSKTTSMISGLRHEAIAYEHARDNGYSFLPEEVSYVNNQLTISAYLPADGWHWEVPQDRGLAVTYAEDILCALDDLSNIPTINQEAVFASSKLYASQGWNRIFDPVNNMRILEKIESDSPSLHRQSQEGAEKLARVVRGRNTKLTELAIDAYLDTPTQFGHFDARPSNIGWHPKSGVRLVDWSWGSNVSKNNDSTMFLIDAHKADFETRDLEGFSEHFSRKHAALFIGYWLARSITPAHDPNVRFHQFASAATAMAMLET